jgi:hypothetical protein
MCVSWLFVVVQYSCSKQSPGSSATALVAAGVEVAEVLGAGQEGLGPTSSVFYMPFLAESVVVASSCSVARHGLLQSYPQAAPASKVLVWPHLSEACCLPSA